MRIRMALGLLFGLMGRGVSGGSGVWVLMRPLRCGGVRGWLRLVGVWVQKGAFDSVG